MNEKDLLELKAKIDKAKTKISELNGQQKQLTNQLKDNWNVSSVEEAERLHAKMQKELKKLETELEDKLAEIQENISEDDE